MVDYCGGTTPRTTIGFGLHPSRTSNPGERVGAIDIRYPRSHPICPNGTQRGLTSHIQHWIQIGGNSINDATTASYTEHNHPS